MPAQRVEQQRVLDGHRGVEVGVQAVALDIELAAQLELHRLDAAVHRVAGSAVLLVVIGLGDGVAPVHHERRVALVGDTGRTDVDVCAGRSGCIFRRTLAK